MSQDLNAESTDSKRKDNPFSFKSFLKRASESDVSEAGVAGHKKSGRKSSAQSRKKESKKDKKSSGNALNEASTTLELTSAGNAANGEEDNPFSFTKFIKRKESEPLFQTSAHGDSMGTSDSSDEDSDVLKRSARGIQHQQQLSHSSKTSPRTKPSLKTISEKKSIFDDTDSSSEDEATLSGHIPSVPMVDDPLGLTEVEPSLMPIASDRNTGDEFSNSSGSPDLLDRIGGEDLFANDPLVGLASTESATIKKLKAENERLKEELLHSKQEMEDLKEKNVELKKKIKLLQKKEKEEAKALEEMVQKVEANLVTSTERALSAEATIVKLKKEIQSLKVKLKQSNLQTVHHQYEEILRGVRDKAAYASQQLASASLMADQSIKELVSGVDTLKNVAQVLQSIDNFTELRQDPTS